MGRVQFKNFPPSVTRTLTRLKVAMYEYLVFVQKDKRDIEGPVGILVFVHTLLKSALSV